MFDLCCEVHKKKEKNWAENDYYDSDEDTFLDRTGISKCLEVTEFWLYID